MAKAMVFISLSLSHIFDISNDATRVSKYYDYFSSNINEFSGLDTLLPMQ